MSMRSLGVYGARSSGEAGAVPPSKALPRKALTTASTHTHTHGQDRVLCCALPVAVRQVFSARFERRVGVTFRNMLDKYLAMVPDAKVPDVADERHAVASRAARRHGARGATAPLRQNITWRHGGT